MTAVTAWLQNNKVIVDSLGRIILCDHCPCGDVPFPPGCCPDGVGLPGGLTVTFGAYIPSTSLSYGIAPSAYFFGFGSVPMWWAVIRDSNGLIWRIWAQYVGCGLFVKAEANCDGTVGPGVFATAYNSAAATMDFTSCTQPLPLSGTMGFDAVNFAPCVGTVSVPVTVS